MFDEIIIDKMFVKIFFDTSTYLAWGSSGWPGLSWLGGGVIWKSWLSFASGARKHDKHPRVEFILKNIWNTKINFQQVNRKIINC